jgi:hypothetical protein
MRTSQFFTMDSGRGKSMEEKEEKSSAVVTRVVLTRRTKVLHELFCVAWLIFGLKRTLPAAPDLARPQSSSWLARARAGPSSSSQPHAQLS